MSPRSLNEICASIGDERYANVGEPDDGHYEIETPLVGGAPDWANSAVVRLPRGGEPPDGLVTVFTGTFAECDAWLNAAGDGGASRPLAERGDATGAEGDRRDTNCP